MGLLSWSWAEPGHRVDPDTLSTGRLARPPGFPQWYPQVWIGSPPATRGVVGRSVGAVGVWGRARPVAVGAGTREHRGAALVQRGRAAT